MSVRKRAYTPEQMQALEAKFDKPTYQPEYVEAEEEKATLLDVLESAQARQPRSMQRAIGPSEMGGACIHCLAARLWGVPRITHGSQATWIGTGAHLMNQQAFDQADPQHERYLTEYKVHVGDITDPRTTGFMSIDGHIDLYDKETKTTVDWKFVGASTLRKAKHEISQEYQVQASLYGIGLANEGQEPEYSMLLYFDKTSISFHTSLARKWRFDPKPGRWALRRADTIACALSYISAHWGDEATELWISALPRDPQCWNCPTYKDYAAAIIPLTAEQQARIPKDAKAMQKDFQARYQPDLADNTNN